MGGFGFGSGLNAQAPTKEETICSGSPIQALALALAVAAPAAVTETVSARETGWRCQISSITESGPPPGRDRR